MRHQVYMTVDKELLGVLTNKPDVVHAEQRAEQSFISRLVADDVTSSCLCPANAHCHSPDY